MQNEFTGPCNCGHIHDSRSYLSCSLSQLSVRLDEALSKGKTFNEGDESELSLSCQDWYHYAGALMWHVGHGDELGGKVDGAQEMAGYYSPRELAQKLRRHVGATGRSYLALARNALALIEAASERYRIWPAAGQHLAPASFDFFTETLWASAAERKESAKRRRLARESKRPANTSEAAAVELTSILAGLAPVTFMDLGFVTIRKAYGEAHPWHVEAKYACPRLPMSLGSPAVAHTIQEALTLASTYRAELFAWGRADYALLNETNETTGSGNNGR